MKPQPSIWPLLETAEGEGSGDAQVHQPLDCEFDPTLSIRLTANGSSLATLAVPPTRT